MRQSIANQALDWVDTPFHHHCAVKHVGVDCVHLVANVALSCQLIDSHQYSLMPKYDVQWHLNGATPVLTNYLHLFQCKIKDGAPDIGDIITFKIGKFESHIGLMVTPDMFVHADARVGKVDVAYLTGPWQRTHCNTYTFNGVD